MNSRAENPDFTLPRAVTRKATRTASVFRMATPDHVCPFGLQAKDLLRRKGFAVDDHPLASREETDAFKARYAIKTTPQVFIDGVRIGGYDDLRRHFGLKVRDPKALSLTPVAAVFASTALLAGGASFAVSGVILTPRSVQWFIAFSMVILAMLKLRDIDGFARMFLGYDLLAQRWVRYAKIYPFAELAAGVLMTAGALTWISAPLALAIGAVGAVSVFKAVYVDRRELKCACVGGDSNVPLGFVSLVENLMMIAMAVWMFAEPMPSGV
ncbi:MAG TPA: MauE/DoxX family redox-associated membrane protein [Hyphomonadaceae bacterium]|nr:MauE/DoxX family redox-associated membrane protein [Hyphomonadaceae bacterium]